MNTRPAHLVPLALLLGACHPTADKDAVDSGTPVDVGSLVLPDLSGMNIVYVHTDTLRADHLPFWGYDRMTTPGMAAREWVQIDGIYGGSSWTVPSTSALLTANPPDVNGLTELNEDAGDAYLPLNVPTVAQHLQGLGWATGDFSGNVWVAERTDMVLGFDIVNHTEKTNTAYNLLTLVDSALPWVDSVPAEQPFFLFIQPMDMHEPYWVDPADRGFWGEAPVPWDLDEMNHDNQNEEIRQAFRADEAGATQALVDVYDEELMGLDRGVEALMTGLEARGLLDHTLFVFGADHGETLNDAGDSTYGHSRWLREELVKNPYLLHYPGMEPGVVPCVAPNMDLMPTFLEALGVPAMPDTLGASLAAGCHPWAIETLYSPESSTTLTSVNASDGHYRYLRDCTSHQDAGYDLAADPAQVHPLPTDSLPHAAGMRADIEDTVARIEATFSDTHCSADHGI